MIIYHVEERYIFFTMNFLYHGFIVWDLFSEVRRMNDVILHGVRREFTYYLSMTDDKTWLFFTLCDIV